MFVALATMLGGSPARAQGYWELLTTGASPSARHDAGMAFDTGRGESVLFGGWNNGTFNDTWVFDGIQWVVQSPATSPGPRHGHSMVHDTARGRVVLFGGWNGVSLGDTWEWDGVTWLQRVPVLSPSRRDRYHMAYDAARQCVVLFGGVDGPTNLGDTWKWDGINWQLQPTTASPSPRHGGGVAYDAVRQRFVLFGGFDGVVRADTWEWDGSTWLAMFSSSFPPARQYTAMVYETGRARVVMFGGWNGSANLSDTWEWDGANWTTQSAWAGMTALRQHSLAYDEVRQRVHLFGGVASGPVSDTWGSRAAGAVPYGTGCGSPPLRFERLSRPVIGQPCTATIHDAPTLVAGVSMGWSNDHFGPFTLPVPLTSIGMTGCELLQSNESPGLGAVPIGASTLSFTFSIPPWPNLIGARVYIQAYAFAPAQNPLGIVSSNAIEWRLGAF